MANETLKNTAIGMLSRHEWLTTRALCITRDIENKISEEQCSPGKQMNALENLVSELEEVVNLIGGKF